MARDNVPDGYADSATWARLKMSHMSLCECVAFMRERVNALIERNIDAVDINLMQCDIALTAIELRLFGDEWVAEDREGRTGKCGTIEPPGELP